MKKDISRGSFLNTNDSLFLVIMRKLALHSFFGQKVGVIPDNATLFFLNPVWVCPLPSSFQLLNLHWVEKHSFYLGTPRRQIQEKVFGGARIDLGEERKKTLSILSAFEEKNCLHLASNEYLKMALIELLESNLSEAIEATRKSVVHGEDPLLLTQNLHRETNLAILQSLNGEDSRDNVFKMCVEKWTRSAMPLGISAFPFFYNFVAHRIQNFSSNSALTEDPFFLQTAETLLDMHSRCLDPALLFGRTVDRVLQKVNALTLSDQMSNR